MSGGLLGKKLGMTQVYDAERRLYPVTVVEAGPCDVTAVKTLDRDGYEAIQLGYREVQERKLTKAQIGHLRASGSKKLWKSLREFRGSSDKQIGDTVSVDLFENGELVDVQGVSRGKGFQGVMKRHNFGGGPATHGSMFHRAPGSVGASSFPSRVWRGKRLPGHMGAQRVTVRGLKIVEVRPEENLLLIFGAVPGPPGGYVVIQKVRKK
ncbi:50S ribosomal protein L3 [Candidatus Nitronereus thalassa]|uniref:Large ribosomal subunit protein uL3 n=1 Tax=Candidatus Nitronereus thalassa TaxID=3020898 RepID=A0ABU3KCF9_9BACT|nr:50S ribosomal protein L3 [Candidatus Nitronereus thalassa]MDT7043857.1 50S ribosomal protein L3 [Candidatus Nitronereus thalassa]